MSDFWTKTTDENLAREKIISNSNTDESFTRDNKDDLEIIENCLDLKKDDKVLDYGCGIGRLMKPLSEKIDNIYGFDISPLHLKMGIKYCPEGIFLKEIPKSLNINKIYSVLVFQHIEKYMVLSVLNSLRKILTDNGKVLLQFPNLLEQDKKEFIHCVNIELSGLVNKKDDCYPLMRFYTKEELNYYFEALGYKNIKIITEKRKDRIWVYAEK